MGNFDYFALLVLVLGCLVVFVALSVFYAAIWTTSFKRGAQANDLGAAVKKNVRRGALVNATISCILMGIVFILTR